MYYFYYPKSKEKCLSFLVEEEWYLERNNLPEKYSRFHWPNVVQRYEAFSPRLEAANTLTLYFESLKADPDTQYIKLFQWIWGVQPLPHQLEAIRQKADPALSSTYHHSQVGQWQTSFSKEHCEAFEELGGEKLLLQLKNWFKFFI